MSGVFVSRYRCQHSAMIKKFWDAPDKEAQKRRRLMCIKPTRC